VTDKARDTDHLFIREERREDSDAKNAIIGIGIGKMGREVRVKGVDTSERTPVR
jgi:hypothetical protein